ncbi:MAG: histidine ammonia-lyase [Parachlamydiales bacterium]|jgi:histidine ammonia-lyase
MNKESDLKVIVLDGETLTIENAYKISMGAPIAIDTNCAEKIVRSRTLVEELAKGDKPVYGVNTGVGWLAGTKIPPNKQKILSRNVVISHAGGMGPSLDIHEIRLAMALRLNVFVKGYTGVRPILCKTLCDMINAHIYPYIPEYGSLGASGDLIPLSHIALAMLGEGLSFYQNELIETKIALKKAGIEPIVLETKEGLALINGTQVMLSVGGLATLVGYSLCRQADLAAALTYEAMVAHLDPLDPLIHRIRNHRYQAQTATNMLNVLKGSYLFDEDTKHLRVQDPYSLRCAPQVHGASRDIITYALDVCGCELNAATDNPLVDVANKKILSGGNFHGQPLAIAFDSACLGVAELANISERRIEVLLNPHLSNLPAFLAKNAGIDSGLMLTQYLAGSFVNENKVLSHPASTDSIPGNVGIEDHVSMGMTSARKLKTVVRNTRQVLGIECIVAAQAIDMRNITKLGVGTRKLYDIVRSEVPKLENDRCFKDELYFGSIALTRATEELCTAGMNLQ